MTVRLNEFAEGRRTPLDDRLHVVVTADPASPVLTDFYAAYDRAFVLPDEKEDLAGFRDCLALNHGEAYARLSQRYSLFRELVIIARNEADETLGGANFIAFADAGDPGSTPLVTVNLNYIFVSEAARGQGLFRKLVGAVRLYSGQAFQFSAGDPRIFVFIEMNDPIRMDAADYARDSEHAGLDQVDRLRIWAKLGARLIDFDYLQPPLSKEQSADDGLLYGVLGADEPTLDACILARHLDRFFSISVLKGRDAKSDPDAGAQVAALSARCTRSERIALLDLAAGKDVTRQSLKSFASYRDHARLRSADGS
jgi:GNAT superfamily N-acetyltransferase